MKRIAVAGLTVTALGLATPAFAGFGKVGTWEMTTATAGNGAPAMPDFSKLPPDIRAKMKARGVQMTSGGGVKSKFCMSAEDVKRQAPPLGQKGNCRAKNVVLRKTTYAADVECTGEMNARGHISMVFDTPEHYSMRQTMRVTVNNMPVITDMTIDAKWLSPNCTVPQKAPTH